jgi:hypothetical protein
MACVLILENKIDKRNTNTAPITLSHKNPMPTMLYLSNKKQTITNISPTIAAQNTAVPPTFLA